MKIYKFVIYSIYLLLFMFTSNTLFAYSDTLVHTRGIITDEGIECLAFRGDDGILYTLVGDLDKYKPGDVVEIVGKAVDASICMQGETLEVVAIAKIAYDRDWFIILEGEINSGGIGARKCILLETKDGKKYGLVTDGRLIKLSAGHHTVLATPRLTKDLPCGTEVDISVNLFYILE